MKNGIYKSALSRWRNCREIALLLCFSTFSISCGSGDGNGNLTGLDPRTAELSRVTDLEHADESEKCAIPEIIGGLFPHPKPSPSQTPTPNQPSTPEPVGSECYRQNYVQTGHGPGIDKLDLAFVIDTSASLKNDRAKIASNIDSFIRELPKDIDLQIGVILGHGLISVWGGRFYSYKPFHSFLKTKSMSRTEIRVRLLDMLKNAPDDAQADGGEEMLYSLNRILKSTIKRKFFYRDFFRSDAAFAAIFISDENDICHPGKVKDVDHVGPFTNEEVAYYRDCWLRVDAAKVYSRMVDVMGKRPFSLNGIVYTDPKTVPHNPKDPENEIGLGIIDIVKMSGGVLADLAKSDFSDDLAKIGRLSAGQLDKLTRFSIHYKDFDPATVWVEVDGARVKHRLDGHIVTIHPDAAGGPGSKISVHYCIKQTTPTPSPTVTPSAQPSVTPSVQPSVTPSAQPSVTPSVQPSVTPSVQPSVTPSVQPSVTPSVQPSVTPSVQPSVTPSVEPSVTPSVEPSVTPSVQPSVTPSVQPSVTPSVQPSVTPSVQPSVTPSVQPSVTPSVQPSVTPSVQPSVTPSVQPSVTPSVEPSVTPSVEPSVTPSVEPSVTPSVEPSPSPSVIIIPEPPVDGPDPGTGTPSPSPSVSPSPVVTPSTSPSPIPSPGPSEEPEPCVGLDCDGGWIGV